MVEIKVLAAGSCRQLHSAVFPGEAWRVVRFPALFALLRHPQAGVVLFDTGYAEHFFEATRAYPYRLYALALPVSLAPHESARAQLAIRGIDANEVTTIVVSHFHGDHIAGLHDFPNATFICSRRAYRAIEGLRGVAATRHGFVPDLLPADFAARCRFLDAEEATYLTPTEAPFERGFDLFGDGSAIAIDLSGHAAGQLGLLLATDGRPLFLVADAAWHSRALRDGIYPAPLSRLLVPSWSELRANFDRLREFAARRPDVKIVPSHCAEIYREIIHRDPAA